MARLAQLWQAYRWRIRRRYLLARAIRRRHRLTAVANRTGGIARNDILLFATIRNEATRLEHFLAHYRALGVNRFLIVDNDSTDGSRDLLADQPDVSLWRTDSSYRLHRFGLDWVTWLMIRYAHNHWCVTVDADELLIYPHHDTRPLPALTDWLDRQGQRVYPAMMLELYPKGPVQAQHYTPGDDPTALLRWFDAGNYSLIRQEKTRALWIQGGPRARMFFADRPRHAPTLTKIPLVRWNRRWVYLNSTHSILPRYLNECYDQTGAEAPSGLLLHTKFLPQVVDKAAEEKRRREHFGTPELFDSYYDSLIGSPDFWTPYSQELTGWRRLESLGLMSRGGWL
ncbi:glycosyl transferase family 2 [Rhodobacter sp. TJ_12]|uniref:glycosyltransferase family 2 protein n=1 Tax=Rhodobacter sp. TJ_12 TaxID=2029399 RepID=UPI001CBDCC77|nr:glycosyltransferase family 2 protein [Rhodobacter sp. TJ_12]MBZ4023588.1 glycosyl transferase family 2 [Rhodobacter sp. TJ_12]